MSAGHLRGVIFDMDGVLVDSHTVHRKAWRQFFQALGRHVPESELDFILDGRKRGDILRHFLGNCPDTEIEEFGRRKDCIFREMQLGVAPVPGVVRFVRELYRSGAALALATSASRSRARSTLTELGLQNCFPVVVTGEDVLLGKRDAAVYRLACNRIGIEPNRLLAVEDAISGVRAAVAAGFWIASGWPCTKRVRTFPRQEQFTCCATSKMFPLRIWNTFCFVVLIRSLTRPPHLAATKC
jgi:beta-phosphoglucomutase